MRKQSLFVKLCLSAMVFFAPMGVSAQVTIGSSNAPSQWSLLDLDNPADTDLRRAFHLPRLDNDARETLLPSTAPNQLAEGLVIFNTETRCLEFWSGEEWISLCDGDPVDPCAGWGNFNTDFCIGATIADLTTHAREAGGRGTIHWFAQETGGTRLADNHPLTDGYFWADNCAGQAGRISVWVATVDCSVAPIAGLVTAWTNVMYDFQTQELSYFVNGGGDAVSWRWYVNTNDGRGYQPISGATQSTFDIPANFMYSAYTNIAESAVTPNMAELHFRVVRENPLDAVTSQSFNMLFIRTTTSGFNHDDVPSLALNRAVAGDIHMALLNEGATNDNSLGNLFQWGRTDDGHEEIDWVKTNGANRLAPATVANTAARPAGTAHLNATTGQVSASGLIGRFLTTVPDFADWSNGTNNLWGDGATGRPGTAWTHSGNNPCPAGWRVPSRYEFWDVHHGNNNTPNTMPSGGFPTFPAFTTPNLLNSGNSWSWRPAQHGAAGGALIRNSNNEVIFLPAVGWRSASGTLHSAGIGGYYWSSTFFDSTVSWRMNFYSGRVNTGSGYNYRAYGFSVRCVAE